jgi:hypothetical protein
MVKNERKTFSLRWLMKIDAIDGDDDEFSSFLFFSFCCVQLHKLKDFSTTIDCLLLITQERYEELQRLLLIFSTGISINFHFRIDEHRQ